MGKRKKKMSYLAYIGETECYRSEIGYVGLLIKSYFCSRNKLIKA